MSSQKHIVIIGGTACGPKAAVRARRLDPAARITVIEQIDNLSTATCGLPYFISGVIKNREDMVAQDVGYFRDVFDLDVLIRTEAINIDRKSHTVRTIRHADGKEAAVEYDNLVIATGAAPIVPDWEGKNLQGIFSLTGLADADAIRNYVTQTDTKDISIIGAGLIGIEMAENFMKLGFNVTLIEALDWMLPKLLDFEVAAYTRKHLEDQGINLLFGQRVSGLEGDASGKVRKVILENGEVPAGLVLLSLGVRPNVNLARDAGLTVGETGGIAVNEKLQTNDPDIYAGGDCVENTHLITGKKVLVPMGSTANKHGRVIGTNLTGGNDTFHGVLGTAIVKVFEHNVGRTGLTETEAHQAGYETTTALVPGEEFADYYPGGEQILVKLVAEKSTGKLLGVQVVGPGEAAKRIDVIATALTLGCKMEDLANLDLSYAPPYNSAMDPLHHAANIIRNKQAGIARTLTPMEVKTKLDNDEEFVLLDVRGEDEWKQERFDVPQSRLLPLPELRRRLEELDRNAEIVIYCHTSVRAYRTQRILEGAGFRNVKFMEGSLSAWPYDDYLS
ncbi:MAG: FAD-dependent oxidoreductase [Dehalococcoidia bacterium]|jgi:NADPH-dependent 2,4-dienoyl-CoA reductase/sulfur reductase-like enzyme/rhodanese-related sulfurtransferase